LIASISINPLHAKWVDEAALVATKTPILEKPLSNPERGRRDRDIR